MKGFRTVAMLFLTLTTIITPCTPCMLSSSTRRMTVCDHTTRRYCKLRQVAQIMCCSCVVQVCYSYCKSWTRCAWCMHACAYPGAESKLHGCDALSNKQALSDCNQDCFLLANHTFITAQATRDKQVCKLKSCHNCQYYLTKSRLGYNFWVIVC